MNKKIIFFDIDGTIFSHRSFDISDNTKAAIKQTKANGHLVFINTGRSFAEIPKEILDLNFDGLICGCGSYISYHGSVLFQKTIDSDIISVLI